MTQAMSVRGGRVVVRAGLLLALCLGGAPAMAGDGDGAGDERAAKLEKEIIALFDKKKYAEGAEKCRAEIALFPKNVGAHYNLACALARMGKTADALQSLASAVELGFDDAEHLKTDEDLTSLHAEKGFEELVAKAEEKGAKRKEAWEKLYDPGPEVEGVASSEVSPANGLRCRLLMAQDATAQKPQRLIVWMHPAGGSMNDTIAPLAAQWTKAGWALLLPTQKTWDGWAPDEASKLLNVTLPEVGKTPGVSVAKPVLMGFSAGGQMALSCWESNPAPLGGLVLDAAYPIDLAAMRENRVVPVKLPAGEPVKHCPLFVLVGDQDGGTTVWKQVESEWRAAGVPLQVDYVAGREHEWLLGEKQAESLLKWLDDVAHDKLPGKEEPKPPAKPPAKKK